MFNVSGLSPFATSFLRSGQAVNFAKPESKFLVPFAQIPSFLLTMQRYEKFIALPNFALQFGAIFSTNLTFFVHVTL